MIKPKRSYHITTNSPHRFRKHRNLIENVTPNRPEEHWVSDMTYIGTRNNPVYLALITDAYSKKIVGYDVFNSLGLNSSLKALKRAIKFKKYPDETLIHHSNRGLQYCSYAYQEKLSKHAILCSITQGSDPYTNAVAVRVNGVLKQEFIIDKFGRTLKEKTELVKDAIKKYNTLRPHYSCYYLTPEEMHNQSCIKIRTYKKSGVKKLFS